MKQIVISENKMEQLLQTFYDLLQTFDKRTSLINKLFETSIGTQFFEAPASNKLNYHNCFVGGLVEHTLRVYSNLQKMINSLGPFNISNDSVKFVALFHDLGKAGSEDTPYYLPKDSDWHKDTIGQYYDYNPNIEYMTASQRSIRLLSKYNIPMSDQEYKAILCHDGAYVPQNDPYAHKEGMLGLLLHHADMLACRQEREIWENIQ